MGDGRRERAGGRPGSATGSEDDGDGLLVGVDLDTGPAELLAVAAEFGSSPGKAWIQRRPAVHGDSTGLDLPRNAMGSAQIRGPQRGREPEVAVVRDGERLLLGVEGDDRAHRSKDLLASDGHVVRRVGEEGRLDEVAAALR